jgi:glutathione S-transferase
MAQIKLTYFDINGGRAEPVRMALFIAGVEYEDNRISFADFGSMREGFPLKAVPTLEVDGVLYTQCNAMARYSARLAGLYPTDAWQAFLCDEVMDVVEDASIALVKTFGLSGDELKLAREKLVEGPFTNFLNLFAKRLEAAGGKFFAGNQLSIADIKVFVWIRALGSGLLDHVPTDLVNRVAPILIDHMDRVAQDTRISGYLSKTG